VQLLRSLSGRLLLLTIIFVMVAEVMIFVPSLARFRADYLQERLDKAHIASLALLATPNDMISDELEAELLATAGVRSILLQRDRVRIVVLSADMLGPIDASYDLRDAGPLTLMVDAVTCALEAAGPHDPRRQPAQGRALRETVEAVLPREAAAARPCSPTAWFVLGAEPDDLPDDCRTCSRSRVRRLVSLR
jgi:hypothetical protein